MFIPSWAEVANGIPGNHTDAIHVAKSEATSDVHAVANGIHMWPTRMQLVRSAIYSTHSHLFCEPQALPAFGECALTLHIFFCWQYQT